MEENDLLNQNPGFEYFETDKSNTNYQDAERIQQINEELQKENEILKSQFEDAVALSSQMEELHSKNSQLSFQLREALSAKDDLSHRLEIAIEANKDLKNRLSEGKQKVISQSTSDKSVVNSEIAKNHNSTEAEIQKITSDLQDLNIAYEKNKTESKMVNQRIEHLLSIANQKYEQNFKIIDDLISFLENLDFCEEEQTLNYPPPSNALNQPMDSPRSKESQEIQNLQKKVRSMKRKIQALKQALVNSNDENRKLYKKMDNILQKTYQERNNLQDEISQSKKLYDELKKDSQRTINNLKEKINSMKEDLDMKSTAIKSFQLKEAETPISFTEKKQSPTIKESIFENKEREDLLATQHLLSQRLKDSNKQNQDIEKKLNNAIDQINDLQKQNEALSVSLESTKSELDTLKVISLEKEKEADSLRNALHSKQSPPPSPPKPKSSRPDPVLIQQINNLKDQLQKAEISAEEAQNNIKQQETKIRSLQDEVKESENKLRETRDDLYDSQKQLAIYQNQTPEDLIPNEAWKTSYFEPDLSQALDKIVYNQALQITSKLQNSFKTIANYYNQKEKLSQQQMNEILTKNGEINSIISSFLTEISIALIDRPYTFENFSNPDIGKDLVKIAKELRKEIIFAKHENESFKTNLKTFANSFGFEFNIQKFPSQVNDISSQLKISSETIQQQQQKIHKLKSMLKKINSQTSNEQQQVLKKISEIKKDFDFLTEKYNKLHVKYQDMKKELIETSDQLSKLQDEKKETNKFARSEKNAINEILNNVKQEQERIFNQERTKNQTIIESLNEELQKCKEQNDRLTKLVNTQKAARDELKNEFEDFQHKVEEQKVSLNQKSENEKQILKQNYENAISQLQKQCENNRHDVEQLAAELAEANGKISGSKKYISQKQQEKKKLENEFNNAKLSWEREKKLLEMQVTAKVSAAESNARNEIEQEKYRAREEKRKIFLYITETFRKFINPGEQIDEHSFKCLLQKVQEHIDKLSASNSTIRRIAHADELQTTEDAVAQLLI